MVPARILEDDPLGGRVLGRGEDPDGVVDARGDAGGVVHVEGDEADGADGGADDGAWVAASEAELEGGDLVAEEGARLVEGAGVVGADDAEAEEASVEVAGVVERGGVEVDGCLWGHWRHGSLRVAVCGACSGRPSGGVLAGELLTLELGNVAADLIDHKLLMWRVEGEVELEAGIEALGGVDVGVSEA